MRGGPRLPALVVMIGLLAGCSDPAGAIRRQQAAARQHSPTPRPTASGATKKTQKVWWQAPAGTRTAGGLKVRTGPLRAGRVRVAVTDVDGHASRTITATASPRTVKVGHFTLTGVKVAKKAGAYGLAFHYRRH
jgi:hypothetical protein